MSYCCTNNAHRSPVSAWAALSVTATFYSATCIDRCNRLNYRTASTLCCACYQQTIVQPTLLIRRHCDHQTSTTTAYSSAPAHRRGRGQPWRMDKFSAVRRLRFKQQKWPWMSFKITKNGASWQSTYDFLLVFHCNYVSILHRFPRYYHLFPKT